MFGRIARNYQAAFSGLPREIWYLSIVMLINRAGSMVLPFLSLYAKQELKLSTIDAGTIVMFFGMGSCIGSLAGGYISDRVGPFRTQIVSLVANGIGFAVLSMMHSKWAFAITMLITSAVADVFRPANGASITFLCPPEVHRKAFVLNRLAVNLGFTIGPVVGGFLAIFSYQWLFWGNTATCIIAAIVFFRLLGWKLVRWPGNPQHAARESEADRSPFEDGKFLFFVFLNFLAFVVFFQLLSTYPLYLKEVEGLRENEIGILLAFNTILVVLFEMVLIEAIRTWSILKTIAWGALLMCWGFSLMPLGSGIVFLYAMVIVWTIGEMLAMPQMMAYVALLSSESNRSRYLGVYMFSISLALVVGPYVGMQLYARDPGGFWHWGTPIGLLVFLGYYAIARSERLTQSDAESESTFERRQRTKECE